MVKSLFKPTTPGGMHSLRHALIADSGPTSPLSLRTAPERTQRRKNKCEWKTKKRPSSMYRGVFWSKVLKKWCAKIYHRSKSVYLGSFVGENSAALRYDEEAIKMKGESAKLNFPTRWTEQMNTLKAQGKIDDARKTAERNAVLVSMKRTLSRTTSLPAPPSATTTKSCFRRQYSALSPTNPSPTSVLASASFFQPFQPAGASLVGTTALLMPEVAKVFIDRRGYRCLLL